MTCKVCGCAWSGEGGCSHCGADAAHAALDAPLPPESECEDYCEANPGHAGSCGAATAVSARAKIEELYRERDEARAEAKHYEGMAQGLQDVLADTPENVERIARVAASTWDGGCRVVAWHVLNALALKAKLDETPPPLQRCRARSDQGLTCGLEPGHDGNHNALAWAAQMPGYEDMP